MPCSHPDHNGLQESPRESAPRDVAHGPAGVPGLLANSVWNASRRVHDSRRNSGFVEGLFRMKGIGTQRWRCVVAYRRNAVSYLIRLSLSGPSDLVLMRSASVATFCRSLQASNRTTLSLDRQGCPGQLFHMLLFQRMRLGRISLR